MCAAILCKHPISRLRDCLAQPLVHSWKDPESHRAFTHKIAGSGVADALLDVLSTHPVDMWGHPIHNFLRYTIILCRCVEHIAVTLLSLLLPHVFVTLLCSPEGARPHDCMTVSPNSSLPPNTPAQNSLTLTHWHHGPEDRAAVPQATPMLLLVSGSASEND